MITTILSSIASSALTLFICWKYLIPKQIDNIYAATRNLMLVYHQEEVQPIQEMIKGYPDIVEEIHDDISKLEFAVDLLSSEGQSETESVSLSNPALKKVNDIYANIEKITSPK